jgi:hypothetical protein
VSEYLSVFKHKKLLKMKTALSVVVVACFVFMTIPKNSFSQPGSNSLIVMPLPAAALILPLIKDVAVSENVTARTKAFKDFTKSNLSAADVTWFKTLDGFIAHFSTPEEDTRVAYNKRGVWQYNLFAYMEDRIPSNIRAVVKQQYYDYKILVCFAYEINRGPVYIIKMEDNKTLKTLTIVNDEMVEAENYTRG